MFKKSKDSAENTILVVDDDYDCRTMVRTILENAGYNIIDCGSGAEALEKLKELKPALVVLDIMMPEMTGYDVVVRMKLHPATQNIPIVMLTAKGDAQDLIVGYKEYGVEYYITKPFTTRQLLAGIRLVLESQDEEMKPDDGIPTLELD